MAARRDIDLADAEATRRLGAELACLLRPGDLVALAGPVGAGKTTLARATIEALALPGAAHPEVPSPTFTLVQSYPDLRVPVVHFDLYRIEEAAEIAELGLDDALEEAAVLVEWPERMGEALPVDRLEVSLRPAPRGRRAELAGHGAWAERLARARALETFLAANGWGDAARHLLKGDASTRRYERLVRDGETAVVMDWPAAREPAVRGGVPYSRLAHLAEDARAFLAVRNHLEAIGVSVPRLLAGDAAAGFLLLEDFGEVGYGDLVAAGRGVEAAYDAAVAAVWALAAAAPPATLPVGDGADHPVPRFDLSVYMIEVELLLDWYWPQILGEACPDAQRGEFRDIWRGLVGRLEGPETLVLRDFHSPNLLWLGDRSGLRACGVLDFQDALIGPAAYDLVSLLQDARIDLPDGLEEGCIGRYLAGRPARLAAVAEAKFRADYAILGAQRATRLLGLFVRLARRDGKPVYLQHIPRVQRYLARNLAAPGLAEYRAWLCDHLDFDPARPRLVRAS